MIWDCERANRYFIKSRKRSIFVTDYCLNDSIFKGMQSSKQGMWKGYHLSIEGIRKGYLFLLLLKNGIY